MYPNDGQVSLITILTLTIIQYSSISVLMLQRMSYIGELITMMSYMIPEMVRFFSTFALIMILFLLTGRFMGSELREEKSTFFTVILDLFDGLMGNSNFTDFR